MDSCGEPLEAKAPNKKTLEPAIGPFDPAMRLYLTGFMGAGKTSVGQALAKRLERPFFDLDATIETEAGESIRSIFEHHGEARFRELEHRALLSTVDFDAAIIATGGGVMSQKRNREALKRLGRTIWLAPDFETILERVHGTEADQRPLFQDPAQARQLYETRLEAYRQSDLHIDCRPGETVDSLAARIALLLRGKH